MERYLDPKNDLVFKKIFGQHPDLLKSFLNAVMELPNPIQSLEYLSPELVPEIPTMKNSIVDVRCIDSKGRHFIVEMQMLWSDHFSQRMVFNASKAYVRQLDKGFNYGLLKPIYALSIVNQDFLKSPKYANHYEFVNKDFPEEKIDFIELVFVELPKFVAQNHKDKRLQVLWLRFLSEINEKTEEVPAEFYEDKDLSKALEITKESAYTKEELASYDKQWDTIQSELTLIYDAKQEGREEGREEGQNYERYKTIQKLQSKGRSLEDISDLLDLSLIEIQQILESFKGD
jgi:predicted transposase/invertase (TIGR01784 family)